LTKESPDLDPLDTSITGFRPNICGDYKRRIVVKSIARLSQFEVDFYRDDKDLKDHGCALHIYNGDSKSSDFSSKFVPIAPIGSQLTNTMTFPCQKGIYHFTMPSTTDIICNICTLVWIWKKSPSSKEEVRECIDFVSPPTSSTELVQLNKEIYPDIKSAQKRLDFLEGKTAFESNTFAWMLVIFGSLFAALLALLCIFVCCHERVV